MKQNVNFLLTATVHVFRECPWQCSSLIIAVHCIHVSQTRNYLKCKRNRLYFAPSRMNKCTVDSAHVVFDPTQRTAYIVHLRLP